MNRKVKIGFLGCGFMGQNAHLRNYAQLDECEIVAVCDKKAEQARLVAQKYQIPTVYSDYHELLANPEIEAIVCSQPFSNHVNLVPDILRAGKHVLTEKPLCIFPEDGEKLAKIAADCGKIHMVAYHKRSDPAIEYAVELIRKWKKSGEMGALKYIRDSMPSGSWICGADKAIKTEEEPAQFVPEVSPSGIDPETRQQLVGFVNFYIHQVNLMRFLYGEDYDLTYLDKSGVVLAFQSESGVPGILEMNPYSTSDDWQENITVCFERAWIRVDLPAPLMSQKAGKVTVFTNNEPMGIYTSPVLPNVCAMRNQAMNFIKAVSGEKAAPCQSAEAVKDLRMAVKYVEMKKKLNG